MQSDNRAYFDRMNELGISGGQMNAADLGQGAEGAQPGNTPGQAPVQQPNQGDSLISSFLQEVPEQHRALLEPYVKKWDSGVTKKFQEIHSQYAPYKELGADPDVLAQAMQLYNTLDNSPEVIYNILREEFEGAATTPPGSEQVTPGAESEDIPLPPALQARLDQQEQVIQKLAEIILQGQQEKVQGQEDTELEEFLNSLKEQFGDFDEDWVLTRIARGMDGAEAIKAWNQMLTEKYGVVQGQQSGGQPRPTTPILSGNGSVPAEEFNPAGMDSKDVKSLVAGLLAQTAQEGG